MLSRPRPNEAFGITQGELTTLNSSGPYVRQRMSKPACFGLAINSRVNRIGRRTLA